MFFDVFSQLCKSNGVSCKKAAMDVGLSGTAPTTWKKRGSTPNGKTLDKIAKYFGVPVSYLLTGEDEKSPAPESEAMTDEVREIIKIYDAAPPELQRMMLAMMRSAAESQDKK